MSGFYLAAPNTNDPAGAGSDPVPPAEAPNENSGFPVSLVGLPLLL